MRGFIEQGTTTTPFDIVMLNGMSRYHLCIEALRRTSRAASLASTLIDECAAMIERSRAYSPEHFEDLPEVREWVWTEA